MNHPHWPPSPSPRGPIIVQPASPPPPPVFLVETPPETQAQKENKTDAGIISFVTQSSLGEYFLSPSYKVSVGDLSEMDPVFREPAALSKCEGVQPRRGARASQESMGTLVPGLRSKQ